MVRGAEAVWDALRKEAALFESELDPRGILKSTRLSNLRDAGVCNDDQANHNPPAASSAAIPRDRCFLFILFLFLIQASHSLPLRGIVRGFWKLAFDLERRRGIPVRSASEEE